VDWGAASLGRIARYCSEHAIQFINIQYPAPLYGKYSLVPQLIAISLRLRGYDVITTLHEFSNNNILRRLSMSVFFLASAAVVMTTRYELDAVLRQFSLLGAGRIKSKTRIIPIGSNLDPCLSPDVEARAESKIISYFGVFYPSKGAERSIEIMQEIDQLYPAKFTFRFIGGTHPYYQDYFENFRRQAEQSLERTEFVLNKPHSLIAEYICTSRFAVLTYNDGVSIRRGSFLAFISSGIPVITNPGKFSSELSEIEERGMYYSDGSRENLRKVMDNLDSPETYIENASVLTAFSARFDFGTIARMYMSMLNEIGAP
jgi:glycosyltransferase involved in cell wall biosynthesis